MSTIYEIAQITIDPARAQEFVTAVEQAKPAFATAKGFRGLQLEQQIEDPSCFYPRVSWDSVDDHMIVFRAAEGFQQWRALASPFFTQAPIVVHSSVIADPG